MSQTATAEPGFDSVDAPTPPPLCAPKYVPLSAIAELISVKGLTCEQAGKILGISKQAVSHRCKKHGIMTKAGLTGYKKHRADIIAMKGEQLLKGLTEEDIKGMSAAQKIVGYGILTDKERLERGQATEITGQAELAGNYTTIKEEREALAAELDAEGILPGVIEATQGGQ